MSSWFSNDNNIELIEIQQRLRPSLISQLFYYPAFRYLKSAQYVGVETEITGKIKQITSGEPLPQKYLNKLYDLLAATYRIGKAISFQMSIFGEEESSAAFYEKGWKKFFALELSKISNDNYHALLLLKAVIFQDDEIGEESFDNLWDQISYRYPVEEQRKEVLPETLIEELKREAEMQNPYWSPLK